MNQYYNTWLLVLWYAQRKDQDCASLDWKILNQLSARWDNEGGEVLPLLVSLTPAGRYLREVNPEVVALLDAQATLALKTLHTPLPDRQELLEIAESALNRISKISFPKLSEAPQIGKATKVYRESSAADTEETQQAAATEVGSAEKSTEENTTFVRLRRGQLCPSAQN